MPLNYSKWDMLELSDDSDIEEHPNVDKKSMIRWKQRDIHEKREARKLKIAQLHSEIELNKVLRPRIQSVTKGVEENGVSHYRAVQRRLKEQPSPDKPNTGAPNQPTYDMMLGQLLGDVWKEAAYLVDGAKVQGAAVMWGGKKVDDKTPELDWASEATVPESKASRMAEELRKRLDWHVAELDRRDKEVQKEIEQEEAEQKKRITSEDIREGWSSSSVSKAKEGPLDKPKPKQKEKEETIEVLNPGAKVSLISNVALTPARRHCSTRRCRTWPAHPIRASLCADRRRRLGEVLRVHPERLFRAHRSDARLAARRGVRG